MVKAVEVSQLLAFQISDNAQLRADELTENKTGDLSTRESAELEQMLEFDLFSEGTKN